MARRFPTVLAVIAVATTIFAVAPTTASASIISDCTADNSIDGNYSVSDLQDALKSVPADVDQYYGCSDLIRQELLNKAHDDSDDDGGKGGKGGKGGNEALNAAATPAQRKRAEREAAEAVAEALPGHSSSTAGDDVGVQPAAAKTLATSAAPGTPGAMIIALIGLVLLFLGEFAARRSRRDKQPTGTTGDSD